MSETAQIEKILHIVKSKMEAHKEFRDAYNEQLALDFNLFNFFSVGENKVSQILAYFLNPNETHGQSDKFLKEFLSHFYDVIGENGVLNNKYNGIDLKNVLIKCEHIITDNRRIDLFIQLDNQYIAIENKIWAQDQKEQLKDYSTYLNNISKGNYSLLYLNPYGHNPSIESIEQELHSALVQSKHLRTISYKREIFTLLDRWLLVCKADNISFFIKQFKQHLSTKFLGLKSHNMTQALKDLVYTNQPEIETILNAYNELLQKAINKLEGAGRELDKLDYSMPEEIIIKKASNFIYEGRRGYKWSLEKGKDKIFIQIIQDKLELFTSYYTEDGTSEDFENRILNMQIEDNKFARKRPLDATISKDEIIAEFLKYVSTGLKLFSNTHSESISLN